MGEDGGEKTQDPTPKRREDARKEGQIAKSQDMASALILFFAVVLLMTQGKAVCELFYQYTYEVLSGKDLNLQADFNHIISFFVSSVHVFMKKVSFFFFFLVLAAVLVNIAQVGFLWLPDKLQFKASNLNPIKGLKKIFSMQGVIKLIMGIVKIFICSIVAYFAVIRDLETIVSLIELTEFQISKFMFECILWIALKLAVALVIIAILDYMYQKWKHEQDLKMTHQEIKEEMKNTLGNPEIISRRRQKQRELAQQRMGQAVPDADVVVTNPTELAVALKYDPETMKAPVVVAKGAGVLAQYIRRIALEHGIPIVERKPLARALYQMVEIDQPIPIDQYAAVAEVLAYVYQLKGKKAPQDSRRSRAA